MSVLGTLLKNRRSGDAHAAWNMPNLAGPELLTVTSRDFTEGGTMALEQCAKMIKGADVSPQLAWGDLPAGTAQLLLVVEDIDVPTPKPAVHCLALIDPAAGPLEPGALNAKEPGKGVQVLRSTIGRGYHGPGPIKGHGPHRYVFQLFALASPVTGAGKASARTAMAAITSRVLGRGRLTGVYER